ncbi:hypothetical protein Bca101_019835 [Brassica carinata]
MNITNLLFFVELILSIYELVELILFEGEQELYERLQTLYKLFLLQENKERTVTAGAVKPLVDLAAEEETGMAEKVRG